MAHVKVTEAQARKLGLDTKGKAKVRRTARGRYHTVCTTCGEEFHTQAAEDRHVVDPGHHRYELVLG